ncbi:5-deoxy-glucuronate isomerase [Brevibacterium permense]|uniref:5-deoxy-glucuronate isomerase n=1 Tax=Brevibacterium permense TaxID=234834 RepID=UPI0021CEF0DE|nr:5-deoxy-glucuronate isomerase [Brevibacterium permense]MCU4296120.1 5-deoxy-glucuronate isomerase [Brevibacterium permense]
MINEWFHPAGRLARDGFDSVVDADIDGWAHTGFRSVTLGDVSALAIPSAPRADLAASPNEQNPTSIDLPAVAVERVLVPLAGESFTVEYTLSDGSAGSQSLTGRASVFHGPADCLYLPTGARATLSSTAGRIAIAEAPTTETRPVQLLPAAEVPVELRGSGISSRQVHNFATPAGLDCVKIIACEVITPGGNWSSYPPHKHDEAIPGSESRLEEIYYFETAVSRGSKAPAEADPFSLFSTYSSGAGEITTSATVRTGDIALVPYGYHGPLAAAPGYDNYYLNVMAGPDEERVWLISDDPAHGWVREEWEALEFDSRLPYTSDSTGSAADDSETSKEK